MPKEGLTYEILAGRKDGRIKTKKILYSCPSCRRTFTEGFMECGYLDGNLKLHPTGAYQCPCGFRSTNDSMFLDKRSMII
jgi:hypothetical protein